MQQLRSSYWGKSRTNTWFRTLLYRWRGRETMSHKYRWKCFASYNCQFKQPVCARIRICHSQIKLHLASIKLNILSEKNKRTENRSWTFPCWMPKPYKCREANCEHCYIIKCKCNEAAWHEFSPLLRRYTRQYKCNWDAWTRGMVHWQIVTVDDVTAAW